MHHQLHCEAMFDDVNCNECKSACLATSIFLYFKDYSDTQQSLFCISEELMETVVTTGDYNGKAGLLQFSRSAYYNRHEEQC
jgi:hypothetical protein